MTWPSLGSLWNDTKQVISRFPLQVAVTVMAVIVSFILIDYKGDYLGQSELIKMLFSCNMALVLLIAADLYAEVNAIRGSKKWGLRLLCLVICLSLYFFLQPQLYLADRFRIGLFIIAFHLLVAFTPFIRKGNLMGFWEYNKVLFLRILTAGLYGAVLYIGLAIALSAIEALFNVDVTSKIYQRLAAVVALGFTTIFFLAGVPADFNRINDLKHAYPKPLKIFTQYVLIPLITIYLVILLVYEAKILLNWELPKGMVSMLVLGYSVFGILSLLLIYPVKDQEGNGWIRLFSRWFYLLMIPLLVLFLLAIWKRVDNYGITESRYILIIIAIWLSFMTAYFLFSKKDDIKIIPVSLCILALVITYGPQSAFSVSRDSQTTRLKKLINADDARARREKPEIIRYLVLNHGLTSLQQFTAVNLEQLSKNLDQKARRTKQYAYIHEQQLVDTAYKLLKVDMDKETKSGTLTRLAVENEGVLNIKGFDYVVPMDYAFSEFEGTLNGTPLKIERLKDGKLSVQFANDPAVIFDADPALIGVKDKHSLPGDGIRINKSTEKYELSLLITLMTIDYDMDQRENFRFKGNLMVKVKEIK